MRSSIACEDLQCQPCQHWFPGERALRRHRKRGKCQPPADAGLEPMLSRDHEVWGVPNKAGEEWFGELTQPALPINVKTTRRIKK